MRLSTVHKDIETCAHKHTFVIIVLYGFVCVKEKESERVGSVA